MKGTLLVEGSEEKFFGEFIVHAAGVVIPKDTEYKESLMQTQRKTLSKAVFLPWHRVKQIVLE